VSSSDIEWDEAGWVFVQDGSLVVIGSTNPGQNCPGLFRALLSLAALQSWHGASLSSSAAARFLGVEAMLMPTGKLHRASSPSARAATSNARAASSSSSNSPILWTSLWYSIEAVNLCALVVARATPR